MGRIRSKILFGLIAYFGGFATAIYYLTPVSQDAADRKGGQISWKLPTDANFDAEKCKELAGQFKQKMSSVLAFAEENAGKVAAMIKTQDATEQKDGGSKTAAD